MRAAYPSAGPMIGRPLREIAPEVGDQDLFEAYDRVYQTGEPLHADEWRVQAATATTSRCWPPKYALPHRHCAWSRGPTETPKAKSARGYASGSTFSARTKPTPHCWCTPSASSSSMPSNTP